MTINDTINFLESLLTQTDKKSEIKVYENFIAILSNLKNRELTNEELQSIEEELETLDLKSNPENKKRYFSKKLAEFKKYLKDKLSLISEGYYTAIGMSLGMIIGLVIGRNKDAEAEKQGRVLKTKL